MKKRNLLATSLSLLLAASMLQGCAAKQTAPAAAPAPAPAAPVAEANQPAAKEEAKTQPSEVKPVKIGLVACISGSNSESGRQNTLGAQAAERYVNANGGIKSLGGAPVELVLIDSSSDPNQSALAVERVLTGGEIVAISGNATSSMTLPMLPVLEKYKIPAIASTAANSTITEKGCSYIFQPCNTGVQSSEIQAEFLGYLAEKMGKSVKDLRIGILYENSAWGQDVAKGNKENCEKAGLNVVVEETYPAGGLSDASPIVTKLKNANVDAILPACYVTDTKLILSTMTSMNYKPVVVGSGSALVWPSLVRDLGEEANGICSAGAWVWDAKFVQDNKTFFDEIRVEYEKLNGEFMAEQVGPSFVSTMMIVQAIENAGSTDSTAIRDEIRKLTGENCEWFALINPNSKFNEFGRNIGTTPVMGQWQEGKLRTVFPPEISTNTLLDPLTLKPF